MAAVADGAPERLAAPDLVVDQVVQPGVAFQVLLRQDVTGNGRGGQGRGKDNRH